MTASDRYNRNLNKIWDQARTLGAFDEAYQTFCRERAKNGQAHITYTTWKAL